MVTFRVLEGTDRGKFFPKLLLPLTIGREEGNQMRLDDERVSRFHAKVQADGEEIILTDLESSLAIAVNSRDVTLLGFVNQFIALRPEKLDVEAVLREVR